MSGDTMTAATFIPEPPPAGVAPPDAWFRTSDGADIPYRIRGKGPALIMVHGWSQSGAMFQHQLEGLCDRYTVIIPDIRGHGEAAEPAGGLRMARLAADLSELIAHLKLDRTHLLGWSMGASVLWAYIDVFGEAAIDRLILVDEPATLTSYADMTEEARIDGGCLFTLQQVEGLCLALRSPAAEETRAGFVASMVTPTIGRPLFDWIIAENAKTRPSVAAEILLSHCAQDWRDVIGRITRPTLVIAGAVSHVNPASQRYIHGRIAGSRYHEFPAFEGGAHFPFLEAPARFNQVLGEFLGDKSL